MSQLNYLEKLLDGVDVEWKPLDDISVKISSGGTPKTGVAEFYDGDIPWLRTQEVNFDEIWDTGVKITEAGVDNSSAKWIPANCVIVAMYGATVGKIGINKIPMTTNQACANIQLDGNIANYRYVFHFLLSQYEYIKSLGSGSQTNINAGIVKKLVVPIPCPDNPEKSLAIQAEIVRILDAFTAMTAKLTAELTAELNMRKKQYNYYRDQLLSFDLSADQAGEGDVEWVKLSTVANIKNGKDWKKLGSGKIPVYGSGGIMQYVDTFAYNKPTVLIPRKGSITNIFYVDEPFWNVDTIYYTELDLDKIIPKFFYYFMTTIDMMQLDTGSGRPSLTQAILNEIKIPLPTLEEQARIISLLDKFDTLTTSLQEGLPREIELRQKQYEYYRDLLLSFPASPAGGPKSHSDEAA